jgi:uncharacterized protein YkwD
LLSLLLAACGTAPSQAPAAICRDSDPVFAEKVEALIAAGVDAQRAKLAPKAPVLRQDAELTRIARVRSCNMVHGADFSHTDAKGHFIAGNMVREIIGRYRGTSGENIGTMQMIGAHAFAHFAQAIVQAWMESPEHRANILNPAFNLAGVGVAEVGDEAFVTQVFYGPVRERKDFN